MVTRCASDIDSLIVNEHFDGSGGGKIPKLWFQLQTTLILIRLRQRVSNLGIHLYRKSANLHVY